MRHFDVGIVGGGIVGLAHAWMAHRAGHSVALFERNHRAHGASIRNFGMVWPIGQPGGHMHQLAMRSRALWMQLQQHAGIWVNECGSLHLARHADEMAILEEFLAVDSRSNDLKLLTPQQVADISPAARIDGLLGALWSPYELCVNPRDAIQQLTVWLSQQPEVAIFNDTTIVDIDGRRLVNSRRETVEAERILVCGGSDFETLFPMHFRDAGLKKCKLQMLATVPQQDHWKLGPHLAGGLTLRHYSAFASCPSLSQLKTRVQEQNPLLDQYGIHVMASQNNCGEVILGDSHLYDDEITPFDDAEIDRLILSELNSLLDLPDFQIQRRWHGVYAKHPSKPVYIAHPQDHCTIFTATGGAGMTLSFGLAEEFWQQ